MKNASYLGPFLTQVSGIVATGSERTEEITVLGVGTQVIRELCSPLPPLPPRDDPALGTG